MRVLIMFDHVTEGAAIDHADALVQARAVAAALESLGHEWMMLGVTIDLAAAREALERLRPGVVFNLVESLGGHGRLLHLEPALLDAMGVAYTGASADNQFITSHKVLAKRLMSAAGIPTAEDLTIGQLLAMTSDASPPELAAEKWMVKSLWEHASVGLGDDSVIETRNAQTLLDSMLDQRARLGGECFAERFVDGREFNLSLLCAHRRSARRLDAPPEILPPAEIVFQNFAATQPKIVGYRAKWEEASFESANTVRTFDFGSADQPLLARLRTIALQCWECFDLTGYARVDFRVDSDGEPFVLEVNTNPCLSPGAGFAGALERANIPFAQAIDRILADAAPSD